MMRICCLIFICIFSLFTDLAFSKSSKEVVLTYYENGAPYCWKDESGEMKGVFVDILTEVLENRLGYSVKHIGLPWIRAQKIVESGQADGFCTIATPHRREYAYFIKIPVLNSPVLIATGLHNSKRKEILGIKSLDELKKYRLVSYFGDGFVAMNPHLKFTLVENPVRAMKIIAYNRADVFFDLDLYVRKSAILAGVVDEIETAPFKGYPTMKFQFGISRKSSLLPKVEAIDEAIHEIHHDGTYERILRRYMNQ